MKISNKIFNDHTINIKKGLVYLTVKKETLCLWAYHFTIDDWSVKMYKGKIQDISTGVAFEFLFLCALSAVMMQPVFEQFITREHSVQRSMQQFQPLLQERSSTLFHSLVRVLLKPTT